MQNYNVGSRYQVTKHAVRMHDVLPNRASALFTACLDTTRRYTRIISVLPEDVGLPPNNPGSFHAAVVMQNSTRYTGSVFTV
jgi:hypothetical protein